MDDNDDFWNRSSAAQDLELARREERENFASAWRRNIYAVLAVVALVAGWLAMR